MVCGCAGRSQQIQKLILELRFCWNLQGVCVKVCKTELCFSEFLSLTGSRCSSEWLCAFISRRNWLEFCRLQLLNMASKPELYLGSELFLILF